MDYELVRRAGSDPRLVAHMAAAFAEYKQTGHLLVSDSSLEHELAEKIKEKPEIQALALYGYQDTLRLVTLTTVMKQTAEVLIVIKPSSVIWTSEEHKFYFEYNVARVDFPGVTKALVVDGSKKALIEVGKWGAKKLTGWAIEQIPFVGWAIGQIAGWGFNKAVKKTGMTNIEGSIGEGHLGVTLDNGIATVDLDVLPITRGVLNLSPPLPNIVTGALGFLGASAPKVSSLVTVTDMKANRKGLALGIKLDPMAEKVWKAAAGLSGSAKNISGLFKKMSSNDDSEA